MQSSRIRDFATCFAAGGMLVSSTRHSLDVAPGLCRAGPDLPRHRHARQSRAPTAPGLRGQPRGHDLHLLLADPTPWVAYGPPCRLWLSLVLFLVYSVLFGTKMPLPRLGYRAPCRNGVRLSPYLVLPPGGHHGGAGPFLPSFPGSLASPSCRTCTSCRSRTVVGMAGVTFCMAIVAVFVRNVLLRAQRPARQDILVLAGPRWPWLYGYGALRLHQVERAEAAAKPIQVLLVQPDSPLRMDRGRAHHRPGHQDLPHADPGGCQGRRAAAGSRDLAGGGHPRSSTTTANGQGTGSSPTPCRPSRSALHANFVFNDTLIKDDHFYNNVWVLDRNAPASRQLPEGDAPGLWRVHAIQRGHPLPAWPGPASRTFATAAPFAPSRPTSGPLAPQICYEILYPNFTRRFIGMGADFIVNGTNGRVVRTHHGLALAPRGCPAASHREPGAPHPMHQQWHLHRHLGRRTLRGHSHSPVRAGMAPGRDPSYRHPHPLHPVRGCLWLDLRRPHRCPAAAGPPSHAAGAGGVGVRRAPPPSGARSRGTSRRARSRGAYPP